MSKLFFYNSLLAIEELLLSHPEGLTQSEIARELGIERATVIRYITELEFLPLWENEAGKIGIIPDAYLAPPQLKKNQYFVFDLDALINNGENSGTEFKISACWNPYQQTKDSKMVENIVKAVAGFMNSLNGGLLLIGISDNREIIGIEQDYKVADPKKPNRDGYELFLRNALNDNLDSHCISFYEIEFVKSKTGKDVCKISCKPTSKPVYFKGAFYARNGNQTRLFTTQEAIEYITQRWL